MREDIAKLICERQRVGSKEKSVKTAFKLNPNLDYDSLEFDWGTTYVSSARHRQEGRCNPVAVNMGKKKGPCRSKNLNENLRPLYQFLDKSVGRRWDDVYSEICTNINPNKAIDFHVLQHVGWYVALNEHDRYRDLYVDENGILCKDEPRRSRRYNHPAPPPTSLHWYDNFWFVQEKLKTPAICGCVHFKIRTERPADYNRYRRFDHGPETCVHGNVAGERKLWYLVEYTYHQPDEVYKVHRLKDFLRGDGTLISGYERYGLSEAHPVHYVYYRDVPEKMKEPITVSKKSVNGKHLKHIRKALMEAAGQAAS